MASGKGANGDSINLKVFEVVGWGLGWVGRPFLEKGPLPLPNPLLSPKAFGLIESLFPVFRKVKAGGADRVRKNILRANQF